MDTLGLKLRDGNISAQGIKIIRTETNMSISEIKTKVTNHAYIVECDAVDEKGLALIVSLFKKLTRSGIACELYEHGRRSSIEFFGNLGNMYAEIDADLDEIIDREDSVE